MTNIQERSEPRRTAHVGSIGGVFVAFAPATLIVVIVGFAIPAIGGLGIQGVDLELEVFALLAFFSVLVALVAGALRTYAHNHDDRKDTDYVGKILTLSATILIMFGAISSLSEPVRVLINVVALVILGLLVVLLIVGTVYRRVNRRSSPDK